MDAVGSEPRRHRVAVIGLHTNLIAWVVLRPVAVHLIKYRITWSSMGERDNEDPVVVEALEYRRVSSSSSDFFSRHCGESSRLATLATLWRA